jgi:hypothetical protein
LPSKQVRSRGGERNSPVRSKVNGFTLHPLTENSPLRVSSGGTEESRLRDLAAELREMKKGQREGDRGEGKRPWQLLTY